MKGRLFSMNVQNANTIGRSITKSYGRLDSLSRCFHVPVWRSRRSLECEIFQKVLAKVVWKGLAKSVCRNISCMNIFASFWLGNFSRYIWKIRISMCRIVFVLFSMLELVLACPVLRRGQLLCLKSCLKQHPNSRKLSSRSVQNVMWHQRFTCHSASKLLNCIAHRLVDDAGLSLGDKLRSIIYIYWLF